jgi:cellulose synthase/poly-beta-1,6-N-acetylglucosamine synthase-like glycosyltransferase
MPKISALIHTHNNEPTLGRTLESLRCVDEIVIVDHQSTDKTVRIAKQYGARVIHAVAGVDRGAYVVDCKFDWIFCVRPNETPSEALEASIFDWKAHSEANGAGLTMRLREQKGEAWSQLPPEMRLADRTKINWPDLFPAAVDEPQLLSGDLLRFAD